MADHRRSKSLGRREHKRTMPMAFGSNLPRELSYLDNIPFECRLIDYKAPHLSREEAFDLGAYLRDIRGRSPSKHRDESARKDGNHLFGFGSGTPRDFSYLNTLHPEWRVYDVRLVPFNGDKRSKTTSFSSNGSGGARMDRRSSSLTSLKKDAPKAETRPTVNSAPGISKNHMRKIEKPKAPKSTPSKAAAVEPEGASRTIKTMPTKASSKASDTNETKKPTEKQAPQNNEVKKEAITGITNVKPTPSGSKTVKAVQETKQAPNNSTGTVVIAQQNSTEGRSESSGVPVEQHETQKAIQPNHATHKHEEDEPEPLRVNDSGDENMPSEREQEIPSHVESMHHSERSNDGMHDANSSERQEVNSHEGHEQALTDQEQNAEQTTHEEEGDHRRENDGPHHEEDNQDKQDRSTPSPVKSPILVKTTNLSQDEQDAYHEDHASHEDHEGRNEVDSEPAQYAARHASNDESYPEQELHEELHSSLPQTEADATPDEELFVQMQAHPLQNAEEEIIATKIARLSASASEDEADSATDAKGQHASHDDEEVFAKSTVQKPEDIIANKSARLSASASGDHSDGEPIVEEPQTPATDEEVYTKVMVKPLHADAEEEIVATRIARLSASKSDDDEDAVDNDAHQPVVEEPFTPSEEEPCVKVTIKQLHSAADHTEHLNRDDESTTATYETDFDPTSESERENQQPLKRSASERDDAHNQSSELESDQPEREYGSVHNHHSQALDREQPSSDDDNHTLNSKRSRDINHDVIHHSVQSENEAEPPDMDQSPSDHQHGHLSDEIPESLQESVHYSDRDVAHYNDSSPRDDQAGDSDESPRAVHDDTQVDKMDEAGTDEEKMGSGYQSEREDNPGFMPIMTNHEHQTAGETHASGYPRAQIVADDDDENNNSSQHSTSVQNTMFMPPVIHVQRSSTNDDNGGVHYKTVEYHTNSYANSDVFSDGSEEGMTDATRRVNTTQHDDSSDF